MSVLKSCCSNFQNHKAVQLAALYSGALVLKNVPGNLGNPLQLVYCCTQYSCGLRCLLGKDKQYFEIFPPDMVAPAIVTMKCSTDLYTSNVFRKRLSLIITEWLTINYEWFGIHRHSILLLHRLPNDSGLE